MRKRRWDQATDAIVIKATKIRSVNLEPAAAELDFFLSVENDPPVESVEALAEAERRLSEMEAKAEYRALNRENSGAKFSEETETMLAKKEANKIEEIRTKRRKVLFEVDEQNVPAGIRFSNR
jgi:hypothetical protein